MKAILALEDGSVYEGESLGATGEVDGEVVFNTSMTGYQEILTDPSYAGQIVTMTYPLIGNYGVNEEDAESRRPFLQGFVVREAARRYSNWRAAGGLSDFLRAHGVVGIEDIDTRALTKRIRTEGAMKGVLASGEGDPRALVEKAKASPGLVGRDLVKTVTADDPYSVDGDGGSSFNVVAFDFGIKRNIVRMLAAAGCAVTVVPASTTAEQALALRPDGIFLSNGPGDPAAVEYAVETVAGLLGKRPIFGICLGHQILALALGGRTYKLKFGHRGGNQPVKNLGTGRVEITAQNHGFAVDSGSLDRRAAQVTHINLNDDTVEGLRCLDAPAFSVQYHPEASPGPHDSHYLFDQFAELMSAEKR